MSRASRSRRSAESRAVRARLALSGALLAGLLAGAPALAETARGCAPFDAPYPVVERGTRIAAADAGIVPASGDAGGGIVSLATPPTLAADAPPGEVLLALPKDAAGALPEGTELGPDARLVASFFSPVLCATVARIVGPEDASAQALVQVVPPTAAVVPNSVYLTADAEVAPARVPDAAPDPYRTLQYALDQAGIERARPLSDGAGARIAVLDSAPSAAHRDLARVRVERVEGGPGEAPAVHGTLVSGVIAATENNGFGMAGVAPGASLLAVPVCTPAGASAADRCTLYDLLRGVDRAYALGAQVYNLSIVGPDNPLLARSMSRLDELGGLVVASAGNEGTDAPRFPAAYPSVIGVGAADRERRRHAGSNHGPSAELLAPGVGILSAVPGDAFAFGTGTSFASAHVSGVLGILLGAGVEPAAARAALFQQAVRAAEGTRLPVQLPPVCDVLARLGTPCP